MPKFIIAQSPLTAFDCELSNALCRVLADDLEPGRVAEKPAQRSNCTARHSGAAGRLAASSRLPASRRLASGDIGLHPFDVAEGEAADEPSTQQRFDMSLNPTPVHLQGGCLDRPTIAAEDPTGVRFLQIPVAHVADRHAGAH